MRFCTSFHNKVKQKNDMTKQNSNKTYQAVKLVVNKPKRIVSKVVDRLNQQGLKSLNGKEYNYMKVWQVLGGRWEDINVSIAYNEVLISEQAKIDKLKKLSALN